MNHNFVIQHFCTTFARRNSLQIYKKMIKLILFSLLIIAISVLLLNIKVLLKKGARFSSQHIHDSEAMRKRGIHCVVDQDREARSQNRAY
jgi:hypothetical protein